AAYPPSLRSVRYSTTRHFATLRPLSIAVPEGQRKQSPNEGNPMTGTISAPRAALNLSDDAVARVQLATVLEPGHGAVGALVETMGAEAALALILSDEEPDRPLPYLTELRATARVRYRTNALR